MFAIKHFLVPTLAFALMLMTSAPVGAQRFKHEGFRTSALPGQMHRPLGWKG